MISGRSIRVAIVDDSLFFREFLTHALIRDRSIEVVGSFGDPAEAQRLLPELNPDVLAVDMEMPNMRGPEFLKAILPKLPQATAVVISALSSNVFEALSAGAVDFVSKPNTRPNYSNSDFSREIVLKIKIAATAKAFKRPSASSPMAAKTTNPAIRTATSRNIIAIGASTGGTEAILEVVKTFPANMPGTVIVQHMPPVFTDMYAQRINKICKMSAKEAKNGDRVSEGLILVAPGDKHMQLARDSQGYYVRCFGEKKVSGHCPSVDVLFDSVAVVAKSDAVGVMLTGMGADGAKGLLNIRQAGGHTFGQDQESCVVYGMPMVAYNIGGVSEQLPLSHIGEAIMRRFSR